MPHITQTIVEKYTQEGKLVRDLKLPTPAMGSFCGVRASRVTTLNHAIRAMPEVRGLDNGQSKVVAELTLGRVC